MRWREEIGLICSFVVLNEKFFGIQAHLWIHSTRSPSIRNLLFFLSRSSTLVSTKAFTGAPFIAGQSLSCATMQSNAGSHAASRTIGRVPERQSGDATPSSPQRPQSFTRIQVRTVTPPLISLALFSILQKASRNLKSLPGLMGSFSFLEIRVFSRYHSCGCNRCGQNQETNRFRVYERLRTKVAYR